MYDIGPLEFPKPKVVALNQIGSGLYMLHKRTDIYVCIVRRRDYNRRCRTFCEYFFVFFFRRFSMSLHYNNDIIVVYSGYTARNVSSGKNAFSSVLPLP